jgi:hypothetical protein
MKSDFGLVYTFFPEQSGITCSDEKCGRPVSFMDKCFIDPMKDAIYCEACGQCVRYKRKMAQRRQITR